jgi:hypothetical protein
VVVSAFRKRASGIVQADGCIASVSRRGTPSARESLSPIPLRWGFRRAPWPCQAPSAVPSRPQRWVVRIVTCALG